MLSAEELDDEFETLYASLLELSSERFTVNSITLSLGNKKHSIEISRIKKIIMFSYVTFACDDGQ